MTLYEINQALAGLVDEETGEIADFEAFESLQLEKMEKAENMACWIKNLRAEAAAIKTEIDALTARKKAADAKVQRLTEYLNFVLAGDTVTSARVKVTYRNGPPAVVLEDEESFRTSAPEKYLRYKEPEINKAAIKDDLKAGIEIPGARLESKTTLQIK